MLEEQSCSILHLPHFPLEPLAVWVGRHATTIFFYG